MDIIIKGIEMLKTCNQCEMRSKCWGEHPFWFDVLMYCPLTDTADRKTEPQAKDLFTDKDGDVWEWRGDAWYCISGDEPQERSE